MFILRLLIKLGASPFHVWVPQVIEGLSWMNGFITLSWQKFAPFILLASCIKYSLKYLILGVVIFSSLIGALNGLSQSSYRKIIAFSSINHLGWILIALSYKLLSWFNYFVVYSLLLRRLIYTFFKLSLNRVSSRNFLRLPQTRIIIISLLSFGGLPPFIGFFPKWLIISDLITRSLNLTLLILILRSLVTLFFYLRLSFASFLLSRKVRARSILNFQMAPWLIILNSIGLIFVVGLFYLN